MLWFKKKIQKENLIDFDVFLCVNFSPILRLLLFSICFTFQRVLSQKGVLAPPDLSGSPQNML